MPKPNPNNVAYRYISGKDPEISKPPPLLYKKKLIRSFCDDEVAQSETLFDLPSSTDREVSGPIIEEMDFHDADFIEIPDFDALGYELLDP